MDFTVASPPGDDCMSLTALRERRLALKEAIKQRRIRHQRALAENEEERRELFPDVVFPTVEEMMVVELEEFVQLSTTVSKELEATEDMVTRYNNSTLNSTTRI
jgi:hypothetical protein